jgi:hypothetical protein
MFECSVCGGFPAGHASGSGDLCDCPQVVPMGDRLIHDERRRQIFREGYVPEHDDEHQGGELAGAALAYLLDALGDDRGARDNVPWGAEWFKPKDRKSNLVRAGALIAAELDRIQRAEAARAGCSELEG